MQEKVKQLGVAICTHDRSADAIACAHSLLGDNSSSAVEILIVDSASSEIHSASLQSFCDARDDVRLVSVSGVGLSAARNAAVESLGTDWIAFLDDDARAQQGWVEAALATTAEADADLALIGGRIRPTWPNTRPDWVGPRWMMFLSCVDLDEQNEVRPQVFGANIVFRRLALMEVGLFPLSLGRRGSLLLSGEESYVEHRLVEAGWSMKYSPSMVVDHIIDRSRIEPRWVLKRAYWGGETEVASANLRAIRSFRFNVLRALGAWAVLRIRAAFGDPVYDFRIRASYAKGIARGRLRSRSQGVPEGLR